MNYIIDYVLANLQINYNKDPYPYIYQLNKNKINLANSYMDYLINDSLISDLSDEGKTI